ncbi:BP74-related protein [Amycolatopsis albidoflavus]
MESFFGTSMQRKCTKTRFLPGRPPLPSETGGNHAQTDDREDPHMRTLTAILAGTAATSALLLGTGPALAAGHVQQTGAHIATIQVFSSGDIYRVELLKQADVDQAVRLMNGQATHPGIPIGDIVRGSSGVNTGYDWHIDPATFQWADSTAEACDGQPHEVSNAGEWKVKQYCPWTIKVVAVTPEN